MDFDEIVVKESPGLCRCCLSEGCYKDMGTEYTWMNDNEVYADMLLECFDIGISQHNDGPNGPNRLICEVCITRLRDACNFKKQVLDSEKKFVDMIGRGEFRPKVLIYQSQMKAERNDDGVEDAEVEYLDEDLADFDEDDLPLKREGAGAPPRAAAEPLPLPKRGRPKKTAVKPEKKKKLEDRPKVKSVVKETYTEEIVLKRQNKLEMARLLRTIITKSNFLLFRWHSSKYMCFYCPEHFINISQLRNHLESHPDIDLSEIIRNNYLKQRIKIDANQLWCTKCPAEVLTFAEYIEHLFERHGMSFLKEVVDRFEVFQLDDNKMSCLECGAIFGHFSNLLQHVHQNHVNVEMYHKYLCEICGQAFADKGGVTTHINQIHCSHTCKYCAETPNAVWVR